jgi:predicted DNA-binding transcriptional regulator YafY
VKSYTLYISILDKKREGADEFKRFNTAQYSKKMFGMFGGELTRVTLECDNSLVGVMIDRFGSDIIITPNEQTFVISVEVAQSRVFLSWLMQFGKKVKILSPQSTCEALKALANEVLAQY